MKIKDFLKAVTNYMTDELTKNKLYFAHMDSNDEEKYMMILFHGRRNEFIDQLKKWISDKK